MSYVQAIVGVLIGCIIIVAVAYPIINDMIGNYTIPMTLDENATRAWNPSGTQTTVLGLLPLMIIVGGLTVIVMYLYGNFA